MASFFRCSILMVLFDTTGISNWFNTYLLNPHFCFIIGFECDFFVARNYSWMSGTSTQTEHILLLPQWKLNGEGSHHKASFNSRPPPTPHPPHTHSAPPPSQLFTTDRFKGLFSLWYLLLNGFNYYVLF